VIEQLTHPFFERRLDKWQSFDNGWNRLMRIRNRQLMRVRLYLKFIATSKSRNHIESFSHQIS
jgi:hypothetical protein